MIEQVKLLLVKEAAIQYPQKIRGAKDIHEIMQLLTKNELAEYFYCFALDSQNDINHIFMVAKGSQDSVTVDAKQCFRTVLFSGCARVIFAHNHPSRNCTPSSEDLKLSEKLRDGARLLDVDYLDFIVSGNGFYSQYEVSPSFFGKE